MNTFDRAAEIGGWGWMGASVEDLLRRSIGLSMDQETSLAEQMREVKEEPVKRQHRLDRNKGHRTKSYNKAKAEKRFCCDVCDLIFGSRSKFTQHLKTKSHLKKVSQ